MPHVARPAPAEFALPSRLGLIAAAASRHAKFRRFPYPHGTRLPDDDSRDLSSLHARLEACASSYLQKPWDDSTARLQPS